MKISASVTPYQQTIEVIFFKYISRYRIKKAGIYIANSDPITISLNMCVSKAL